MKYGYDKTIDMADSIKEEMSDVKNSIIILLGVIIALLFIYISFLWSQKEDLQEKMDEIAEINKLKENIISKGDLSSYNWLCEKNCPNEVQFVCEIILADVYHRPWCGGNAYSSLRSIYSSHGLEMNPMVCDMMEDCMLHSLKSGRKSDSFDLANVHAMKEQSLARYHRMIRKSREFRGVFEQISKADDIRGFDGKIEEVSVMDSLYCLKYSYRYGDSTYTGTTYREFERHVGDTLSLSVPFANKRLSMDDVMYQLCNDHPKD